MFFVVCILFALCSSSFAAEVGVAQITGTSLDSTITGHVYFVTINNTHVWVWADIKGITNNIGALHGMHVHTLGDISSEVGDNVASHFIGVSGVDVHRCEDSSIRHEGDMGNWQVSVEGNISEEKSLDLLSLSGEYSIIGRSVILHNFTDDCNLISSSQKRLAQGVIGIANPNNLPPAVFSVFNSTINSATGGSETMITTAIVKLQPINSQVNGTVTFYQNGTGLTVQAALTGLKSTNGYGFHVHLFGDLNSADGSAAGKHFNASYDLGNICTFGSDGTAYYNFHFEGLLVDEGLSSILGRSVIVHALWDPAGIDEGVLIAQGVIGINGATRVTFPENIIFNSPDCQPFAPEIEIGVARLVGDEFDPTILGFVYFAKFNTTHMLVWANVSGITNNPDSPHGLHVHTLGDITIPRGLSVEGHYVGSGENIHSCEFTDSRHEGDMGNWEVNGGVLNQIKYINLLSLSGINSIIGRSVVLHNQTDDCVNIASAGNRLAQGVIGIANPGIQTIPKEISSFLGLSSTSTVNNATAGPGIIKALSVITSISNSNVSGIVSFEQEREEVIVKAIIYGLNKNGAYGFHLHTFGDMSLNDGTSASSHYNPTNVSHSLPPYNRHIGDLGNICTFDEEGTAYYQFVFTSTLDIMGPLSVLGRSVIVHAIRDDGGTNYGTRIGQGVIGLGSLSTNVSFPPGIPFNNPICPLSPSPSPSPSPSSSPSPSPTLSPTSSTSSSSSSSTSGSSPTPAPKKGNGISAGAKATIAFVVIFFVIGTIIVVLYYQRNGALMTIIDKFKGKKSGSKKSGEYMAFEDVGGDL